MKAINNLRIGVRLGLGFAVLIAAALAIALFARVQLGSINDSLKLLVDDRVDKVRVINHVKGNVGHIASAIRTLALVEDPKAMQDQKAEIDKARASNGELLQDLDRRIQSPKGRELLKELNELRPAYNNAAAHVAELGLAGKRQEAVAALLGPLKSAQEAYVASLDKLIAFQTELMTETNEAADATVSWASTLMIALAAITGSFGAFIAWFVTRSITAPIREAVGIAETVAAGDLRSQIEIRSKDETGQLLGALHRMNDSLLKIVKNVRGNADSVSTASTQIAQGNADLSQRTEEQASNLQQTAASMEQLTATVKQNAETAQTASQLAESASSVAAKGGAVVGKVISTMEEISASSKKIADIIGVIDGIAFQTNILALNAAVEAARAGEQGRGFAVVAGEVRNLAQRSAAAAKEIKDLIGTSVEKVQAGSALVDSAGQTMSDIVSQVSRVSDLINEISAASTEQTQGISQVGDAVSQLDEVTQQNAALVEESAAAADSLMQQAAQLAHTVSVFKTEDDAGATVRPAAPAAPAAVRKTSSAPAEPAPREAARPRARAETQATAEWAAF